MNGISDTRFGPMVHARLNIAEENSGRLVSLVRQEARKLARERNLETAQYSEVRHIVGDIRDRILRNLKN